MDSIKHTIREKINALAKNLGGDASQISDDDMIPETGLLDSLAIVQLVGWLEDEFNITIEDEEFTLKNLGTLNSISSFVATKQGCSIS